MDLSGEFKINATREQVWAALNDADILRQAIPGCEELNKLSETEMEAVAKAKIGPVSAKFKGKVKLSNMNPPEGYTLTGEGTGGAAGFAKGEANVSLIAEGQQTILRYQVNATVGGKLAQIGQRLIEGAAKKLADEFFQKFSELAGGAVVVASATAKPTADAAPRSIAQSLRAWVSEPPAWLPIAVVIAAIVALLVALLS